MKYPSLRSVGCHDVCLPITGSFTSDVGFAKETTEIGFGNGGDGHLRRLCCHDEATVFWQLLGEVVPDCDDGVEALMTEKKR